MKVFGLTGGIACGKSTVARHIQDFGFPVLDADVASREIFKIGQPAYNEVIQEFGNTILDYNLEIIRSKLGEIVFSDPDARLILEGITHPAIRKKIAHELTKLANKGHNIIFVEAALLVENGSYNQYSGLLVVSCSRENQLKRLMSRNGLSISEAEKRISSQLPLSEKEAKANWLIHNNGTTEDLKLETLSALQQIQSTVT